MAIGWGTAFDGAVKFILYSILWDIIGIVIILFALNLLFGLFPGLLGQNTASNQNLVTVGILFLLCGLFFIVFGNAATILKVFGNTIADEVEARSRKHKDDEPNYIEKLH